MFSSRSFVLLVVAGVCWGTGGVTGRALAEVGGLSAPAVAAYRLLIGGTLLVTLLVVHRRLSHRSLNHRRPNHRRPGRPGRLSREAWRRIVAVGSLAAVFQASYFSAVAVSSVTVATLIAIGSAPLLVLIADAVTTRRLPDRAAVRPVLLGLAGLALLVGTPTGQSVSETLAGIALSLVAGAGFAMLTLLGRRPVEGLDDATTTGYGFLLGGAALAGVLTVLPGTAADLSVHLSTASVALLTLLGTVPTALAYTLYFRGLRSSSAVTATVVALLEPLTATVLAVALLGERLSVPALVGAVLLLTSVVDTGRRPAKLTAVAS